MDIQSIKKYTINDNKTKKSIFQALTKTRIRTSKIIKFRKHIGQLLRERIPVLSPLQELISGKSLISEVSIIKYSASRRGRIIIIGTEGIFAYILIFYGNHIIREASKNISNIIFYFKFPHHVSIQTVVLMIVMSVGTIGYYGMIKSGDLKQAIKEHNEECDND